MITLRGRLALVLGALFNAEPSQAVKVAVTITGRADIAYELDVSGVRRTGRLASQPGPVTIRDLVEVRERGEVTAGLRFRALEGGLVTCPEVKVRLDQARAVCEPTFVLKHQRCLSRCEHAPAGEEKHGEDEEEETLFTMASQSFYTASMVGGPSALIYSAPDAPDEEPRDER